MWRILIKAIKMFVVVRPHFLACTGRQPPVQWVLGLFTGGKAAGAWLCPPTPSRTEVMKEQSYTSNPRLGLDGLFYGELLHFSLH
jgi:hypothetical protein